MLLNRRSIMITKKARRRVFFWKRESCYGLARGLRISPQVSDRSKITHAECGLSPFVFSPFIAFILFLNHKSIIMNTTEEGSNTTEVDAPEVKVVPTVSKGTIFKKKMGYSKTMKRNMKKHNCRTPEQYRTIRNSRKREGFPALPKTKTNDKA